MRMAIVADWLPVMGGAERVIAAIHALWPESPIFTTVAKHGSLEELDDAHIVTSGLQKWYSLLGRHQPLLPWMPRALESMNFEGYDIVLSSSHAVGKGVIVPPSALHVCYCHTPMRYAWEMEQTYLDDFGIPKALRRRVRRLLSDLRRWDLTTAMRTDHFIANSKATQERIERIYGRTSTVMYPPVSDAFFDEPLAAIDCSKPYLAFGRLVPYKRFDLLIETANTLKLPLRIAGTGHDESRLKAMAGPTIEFLGRIASQDLAPMYRSAKALLYPQIEDAGVVPLEAQACGVPVIALGQGGALETVIDGETGCFFEAQTVASLSAALARFERQSFDPARIRSNARRFATSVFSSAMRSFVEEAYAAFASKQLIGRKNIDV